MPTSYNCSTWLSPLLSLQLLKHPHSAASAMTRVCAMHWSPPCPLLHGDLDMLPKDLGPPG